MRILLVEDEVMLRDGLTDLLEGAGHEVVAVGDGLTGAERGTAEAFDMVVLDLMLPRLDGLEVCRRLRLARPALPVLMLTAKGDEADKVAGLSTGADDYVTKPFSHRELVARIRAVLRRGQDTEPAQDVLQAGEVRMNVERHEVTLGDEPVRLALKEFELLEMFLRNPGRVLTRGQLIDRVWGADYVGDTKTLDVHVKRLRAKIEPDPTNPVHLITVRGLGYKFEA